MQKRRLEPPHIGAGKTGSPGRSGLPFFSFALGAKSVQIAERYRFPSLEARADAQVAGKSIRT
jgi:hypothetical protein